MSEKIIAVSAGREITETEFNEFLSKLPEQQQAYVATEEGRKQALTQYANLDMTKSMTRTKLSLLQWKLLRENFQDSTL